MSSPCDKSGGCEGVVRERGTQHDPIFQLFAAEADQPRTVRFAVASR